MRVLIDSSVWIDHVRQAEPAVVGLLAARRVFVHPYVLGEIALGTIRNRAKVLAELHRLKAAPLAAPSEVAQLIETVPLIGRGIGYVDAHLLASALLARTTLLTHDRRLRAVADELGIAYR